MEIIFIIISSFIASSFITLLFIDKKIIKNISKPKNNVHFYVARDKDGSLWLHIGKPIRDNLEFSNNLEMYYRLRRDNFKYLGLNEDDYANLKWEDEPVEVFLNLDDWALNI